MASTKSIVVIGHKNPDTDSVCSAIGYARYKSEVEKIPAVAYRAGNLNAQTRHVLKTFNTRRPDILTDVYPRVRDIMIPKEQLILVRPSDPIAGARQLMLSNRFSFLPIADREDRCVGKLTALRLATLLDEVAPSEEPIQIDLKTLSKLARPTVTLGPAEGKRTRLPTTVTGLVVEASKWNPGAGGKDAVRHGRLSEGAVILFGRADEITTLQEPVAAFAIATDFSPGGKDRERLLRWSLRSGIQVLALKTGYAQAAAYLRLSQSIESCIEEMGPTFRESDTVREVLRDVNRSNEGGFVVLDAQDRIAGVVTRVNFMTDARFRVVLVDHNEFSQAVDGMEHAHITEIIDHHRIGGRSTAEPITFVNRAVGSTCTVVADIYRQSGGTPSRDTAGLLLSGILSDTVILRSPTTTPADRTAAEWLEQVAGVEMNSYGESMFEAGSEMHRLSPREIIELDLKYYEEEGVQFSVSQVEMTGFKVFWDRSQELREGIDAHRARAGLAFACLMVTDITRGTTLLVVSGGTNITGAIAYPQPGPFVYEMHDVLSRKKQVLPYLIELVHAL